MRSPRASSFVVTLALLVGLCAATPTSATEADRVETASDAPAAQRADGADRAERALRADAVDPVTVHTEPDGLATFVGTLGRPVEGGRQPATATPVQAARGHLDSYGELFGIDRPGVQLDTVDVVHADGGSEVVTLGQQVGGLPVIGGELAVSLDADGGLESVNGETTDANADVAAPAVSASAAVRTAVRTTARTHSVRARTLSPGTATQWFFDPELLGAPDPLGARPVWRVEVSNGLDIRELVLVDTATGAVVAHVDQVAHIDRVVCDQANARSRVRSCSGDYARTEPSGQSDVDLAFQHAGDTSDLFADLGVDLTRLIGHNAGDGKKLRSTVRFCLPDGECPMRNAFWTGREMYYGQGFARADDVVAHELTHGVIQHTSNLLYFYQSGAINESMADVFGEIVDLRNGENAGQRRWVLGEDVPGGVIRNLRRPGQFGQPDRMRSRRYVADRTLRDNGGVHTNSGVGNKAAYLIAAGGRFNGRTVRGLGTDRTARIYFRALTMLTSGSDYGDLGRVLPQACRNLVGRAGIRTFHCNQVGRAVRATEMHLQPRTAPAPEAPHCPPRTRVSKRAFFDDMERRRRVWGFGRLWSRTPGRVAPFEYATSGRHSIFGLNPAGKPRRGSLTLQRRFRVPRGAQTFLRFDHAYLFEYNLRSGSSARYFDGGRVEYSTNGGRTWSNAERLPWVNGPRQLIRAGARRNNFRGFGGESFGYRSSRLNLTRLGGRNVRLRWTVQGDATGRYDGWWLDDVEVFSCR